LLTQLPTCGILQTPTGGSGAAEPSEPCQVREEAALRKSLWVPPGCLPAGIFLPLMWKRLIPPILLILIGGALLTFARRATVTLIVDEESRPVTTWVRTVAEVLREQGVTITEDDAVLPPPDTPLRDGMTVRVTHATTFTIQVNDEPPQTVRTTDRRPANVLAQASVPLFPGDVLLVDGQPTDPDVQLSPGDHDLHVLRAVSVELIADGETRTLRTTQTTVDDLLAEAGVAVGPHDRVNPAPDTLLRDGLTIVVRRARPVTVVTTQGETDGWTVADTVGGALSELGMPLQGLDYSRPPEDAPIPADGRIEIVHVREEVVLEDQPIPFETLTQPLPDLEIDQQRVVQVGAYGLQTRRVRVRYENGEEVSREVEEAWVSQPPRPRILGYGTKIVVRTLNTPDGPIEYWRAVTMYATSYSPCRLGILNYCNEQTYSGQKVQKGIAAVVRSWYPYLSGQQVYVPGYGVATIADIGAGIPGRYWIDLGYSDDDYVSWHQYVTVYFLTPVPPPDQIQWILP